MKEAICSNITVNHKTPKTRKSRKGVNLRFLLYLRNIGLQGKNNRPQKKNLMTNIKMEIPMVILFSSLLK